MHKADHLMGLLQGGGYPKAGSLYVVREPWWRPLSRKFGETTGPLRQRFGPYYSAQPDDIEIECLYVCTDVVDVENHLKLATHPYLRDDTRVEHVRISHAALKNQIELLLQLDEKLSAECGGPIYVLRPHDCSRCRDRASHMRAHPERWRIFNKSYLRDLGTFLRAPSSADTSAPRPPTGDVPLLPASAVSSTDADLVVVPREPLVELVATASAPDLGFAHWRLGTQDVEAAAAAASAFHVSPRSQDPSSPPRSAALAAKKKKKRRAQEVFDGPLFALGQR